MSLDALWKFEEPSGAAANDSSGNGRGLTLFGGYTRGVAGRVGPGTTFNGTTGYGSAAGWSYGTAMSFAAWVKPAAITGASQIILSHVDDSGGGMTLYVQGDGTVRVYTKNGGAPGGGATSTTVVPTASFTHVVGTSDGANNRMYINGVLEAGPIAGPVSAPSGVLTVGSFITSGVPAGFFNGVIDEARVYGHALSQAEVTALFADTAAGGAAGSGGRGGIGVGIGIGL